MKVLWATIDRSRRAINHFDDLRNAFFALPDVKTTLIEKALPNKYNHPYHYVQDCVSGAIKNTDITQICENEHFDCIVVDAPFAFLYEDWHLIKIPTYFIIEDEHSIIPQMQVRCADLNNITILYRYQTFKKTFPNLRTKTIWFPHSVNVNRFRPIYDGKDYDILQTGVISKEFYPLRNAIHEALSDNKHYTYIPRPKDEEPNKWPIGEDYVKVLNKAKLCVTGLSKFSYAIMKVFEIAACDCALVCNFSVEMADLGFQHGKNMFDISQVNFNNLSTIKGYKTIIKNANKLIQDRHTNEIRAKELFEVLNG